MADESFAETWDTEIVLEQLGLPNHSNQCLMFP